MNRLYAAFTPLSHTGAAGAQAPGDALRQCGSPGYIALELISGGPYGVEGKAERGEGGTARPVAGAAGMRRWRGYCKVDDLEEAAALVVQQRGQQRRVRLGRQRFRLEGKGKVGETGWGGRTRLP